MLTVVHLEGVGPQYDKFIKELLSTFDVPHRVVMLGDLVDFFPRNLAESAQKGLPISRSQYKD